MGRRALVLLGAVGLLAPAVSASAQARTCDLVQPADFSRIINAQGEEVFYFRDPVRLRCGGGIRLAGDSAIVNQAQSALELVGAVVYQDSTTRLESSWANYLGSRGLLLARGNVVLTDLVDGSVLTGQELEYQRETETRPVSRMIVRGGRPRAVLRSRPSDTGVRPARPEPLGPPAPGGAPQPDTAAPLQVVADRVEIVGETLFLAAGDVDLERGETTGAAETARYDQATGRITLEGDAWVADPRYRLEGRVIDALMPDNELREVFARDSARLRSEELEVDAERLNMSFAAGQLERMQAWTPDSVAPTGRARALAEGFDLTADSIDARADSGRISEVRAVGLAYGERDLDSLAMGLPNVAARDWIRGDTIIGYFTQVQIARVDSLARPGQPQADVAPAEMEPTAPVDAGTTAADSLETVLERVVVIGGGGPAVSLYRLEPEGEETRPSINFMKASRIVLFLSDGEVTRVEAAGPIEGMYLDPVAEPAPAEPVAEGPPEQVGGAGA